MHSVLCYRPTVCPSVCPSVRLSHEWISQKRLKLGLCNFHRIFTIPLVFAGQISFRKWGGKNSDFPALCVNISKTVRDSPQLLTNMKLVICALSISTKVDDLGWLWIATSSIFFRNFAWFRRFRR